MRYITNENGYIQAVSFNNLLECQNKLCTEYTGTVPTGYESLAEWSENANINAYKIVEGNLTFDSEEDARLQSLWASQETSSVNDAEILNTKSDSTTDIYSCDYVNQIQTNIENTLFFKDGDTVEIGYHTVGGTITGGSKDIQFSIVVPKSLKKIKSFTINSLHITARGINGYITGINGNYIYVSDSDITYSNSSIATENILNIRLARNEVFGNVTNNTPVSIAINSAKFTFNE